MNTLNLNDLRGVLGGAIIIPYPAVSRPTDEEMAAAKAEGNSHVILVAEMEHRRRTGSVHMRVLAPGVEDGRLQFDFNIYTSKDSGFYEQDGAVIAQGVANYFNALMVVVNRPALSTATVVIHQGPAAGRYDIP